MQERTKTLRKGIKFGRKKVGEQAAAHSAALDNRREDHQQSMFKVLDEGLVALQEQSRYRKDETWKKHSGKLYHIIYVEAINTSLIGEQRHNYMP